MIGRRVVPLEAAGPGALDAGWCVAVPRSDRPGDVKLFSVPLAVVVGPDPAGARALGGALAAHPRLRGQSAEVHFFDRTHDLASDWPRYVLDPAFFVSTRADHLRERAAFTVECSSGYFTGRNGADPVPRWVAPLMPSGRFVVVLADPVDAVLRACARGGADGDRRAAELLDRAEGGDVDPILEAAYHGRAAAEWVAVFGRAQLWFTTTPALVAAPGEVAAEVLGFLGLPPAAAVVERLVELLPGPPDPPAGGARLRARLRAWLAADVARLGAIAPGVDLPWRATP